MECGSSDVLPVPESRGLSAPNAAGTNRRIIGYLINRSGGPACLRVPQGRTVLRAVPDGAEHRPTQSTRAMSNKEYPTPNVTTILFFAHLDNWTLRVLPVGHSVP